MVCRIGKYNIILYWLNVAMGEYYEWLDIVKSYNRFIICNINILCNSLWKKFICVFLFYRFILALFLKVIINIYVKIVYIIKSFLLFKVFFNVDFNVNVFIFFVFFERGFVCVIRIGKFIFVENGFSMFRRLYW